MAVAQEEYLLPCRIIPGSALSEPDGANESSTSAVQMTAEPWGCVPTITFNSAHNSPPLRKGG